MLFKVEKNSSTKQEEDFRPNELRRYTADYIDYSQRFYNVSRDFSKQYAHIYSARLNIFRIILEPVTRKKWHQDYNIFKLCQLREKNTPCVIIGTLFKFQELKPSILKELSDELEIIPQPTRTHFVHDSDSLVLEDELQRIKLVGDSIDVHQVVTGVVCAVLGSEEEDGVFTVKDVCWAGCGIQKPLPVITNDRYIVLVSGLNMASKKADHMFSLHLLLEWLSGMTGTSSYQEELSKIVRVIVAGKSFYRATRLPGVLRCIDGTHVAIVTPEIHEERYFNRKGYHSLNVLIMCDSELNIMAVDSSYPGSTHDSKVWEGNPLKGVIERLYEEDQEDVYILGGVFANYSNESSLNESDVITSAGTVDTFCAAISAVAPLDLMPGSKDPTGIMLPQKPFHYCLFPKSIEYKSFNRVSNPYECDIGGLICLGSSGETVKDIMRYSKIDDPLVVMRKMLEWRHIAPTCPDTVPCTPCIDSDPFVIQNCPAIYFSGNSEDFATDIYEGNSGQHVRLVCVPDFCSTKTVALVNMVNLECYSMKFA